MRLSLGEIARIVGGTFEGDAGVKITDVCIDSREAGPGHLFVAIKGEFLDGNLFIHDAAARGAVAALSTSGDNTVLPTIVVRDPVVAITTLAACVRDEVDPIVVGLTGSTGKTSTKDLLRSVSARKFETVAARNSFNNEIGVPLTLLSITRSTEVAVCELGARGSGHIKSLCRYVRPQIGVLTNVGVSHFGYFGSREAIAEAKTELVRSLPEGGVAILNADDAIVSNMASATDAEVFTYGVENIAWLRATNIKLDQLGRPTFRMVRGPLKQQVELPFAGSHQVYNALAAAACGLALGLSLEECKLGLESAVASPWRMAVTVAGGVTVVNDAYNANPTSMKAAITTCAELARDGRLIAVLGFMAELGEISQQEHESVGRLAGSLASRLVLVGNETGDIAGGARSQGAEIVSVDTNEEALEAIGELSARDVVLVKASRAARLESIAAQLIERLEQP